MKRLPKAGLLEPMLQQNALQADQRRQILQGQGQRPLQEENSKIGPIRFHRLISERTCETPYWALHIRRLDSFGTLLRRQTDRRCCQRRP